MPNLRRFAYRDRFVWYLTQTMTGGSSALPPIAFADDTPTDILISLTGNEFNRLLSALMTGADLSYPEQSHETVWSFLKWIEFPMPISDAQNPTRFDVFHRFSTPINTTLTVTYPTFMTFQNAVQTEAANARRMEDTIFLSPGTWNYRLTYPKSTDAGITNIDLLVPGGGTIVLTSTLDQYGLFNAEFIFSTTFVVTVRGFYTFRLANFTDKNPSSSGLRVNATSSHFWRNS